VRTRFEFDFDTKATPDQVIELMTDYSPNRSYRWPASSVKAFKVYHLGDSEADIREGHYRSCGPNGITTGPLPARSHCPWSRAMQLRAVADDDDGDTELGKRHFGARRLGPHIKEPQRVAGIAVMRVIGARYLASHFKKVYDRL
jgi:hypothetical protein